MVTISTKITPLFRKQNIYSTYMISKLFSSTTTVKKPINKEKLINACNFILTPTHSHHPTFLFLA